MGGQRPRRSARDGAARHVAQKCACGVPWRVPRLLQVFDLLNQRKRLNILEDGKKQVRGAGGTRVKESAARGWLGHEDA